MVPFMSVKVSPVTEAKLSRGKSAGAESEWLIHAGLAAEH